MKTLLLAAALTCSAWSLRYVPVATSVIHEIRMTPIPCLVQPEAMRALWRDVPTKTALLMVLTDPNGRWIPMVAP